MLLKRPALGRQLPCWLYCRDAHEVCQGLGQVWP